MIDLQIVLLLNKKKIRVYTYIHIPCGRGNAPVIC